VSAAHDAVGHHRQHEREREREESDRRAEHDRDAHGMEVVRIAEQRGEILEPHEFRVAAERALDEHRLLDRLRRRPDEEDQRDRDLRRDQEIGQQLGLKDDALDHGATGIGCAARSVCSPPPCGEGLGVGVAS
jgi:hypothetical protein